MTNHLKTQVAEIPGLFFTCRFSPRMASVDRHDLGFRSLSHVGGGPVCLTHHFIFPDAGTLAHL